jgi:ABC-2 type transport system permease protein
LFYIWVLFAYAPFIVLPALAGSWGILFFVRILSKPWVKNVLILAAVATVVALVFGVKPVSENETTSTQDTMMFYNLLRHSRASLNPMLPSAWLAKLVLNASEGWWRPGAFYFLVLLSNALMGLLVGFEVVGRFFYDSWTAAASSRAERFQRQALEKQRKLQRLSLIEWVANRTPFFSRPVKALALKDVRIFWRDPAQWTQFMIFFGLLCIYVLNLRHVSFEMENDFWAVAISDLNLAASSLTLSTLTTRFVFPQFSLEGRRLWIIGLAPLGLKKVLLQKFWLSCISSMCVTVSLMVASSCMLHMPWSRVIYFSAAIAVMSATLCGLAVGVGALFPNLKEDNPSKIVSGFGGTLCLVVSFIYITCFVSLVAIPGLRRVISAQFLISDAVAVALAGILSAAVLLFPMILGMRRVKNLEF